MLLCVFVAGAAAAAAQTRLYVEHAGRLYLVRRTVNHTPWITMADGKWVEATEGHFVLRPAPEYLPLLISLKNVRMAEMGENLVGSDPGVVGNDRVINLHLEFEADFRAPYALHDVFIALAGESKTAGSILLLQQIGDLEANRVKHISIRLPMSQASGKVQFDVHTYVGGQECFNSKIPPEAQEAALNRMVEKRIANVDHSEVQPLLGVVPEYPPELIKAGVKGQATVAFTVGRRGNIIDPEVKSATDPAFGASALAAIRLWRFLPRIKDSNPQETPVELPFDFAPPK